MIFSSTVVQVPQKIIVSFSRKKYDGFYAVATNLNDPAKDILRAVQTVIKSKIARDENKF